MTLLLLGLLAGANAAETAAPAEASVRGLSGNMIEPVSLPQGTDPADAAWLEIAALIKVTPALQVLPPRRGMPPDWSGYIYWQEFSNRLLREAGLRFCAEFPGDSRCWIWLQATLERGPQYLNLPQGWQAQADATIIPGFDEAARAAWRERYPPLRAACIAAAAAPEELRVTLWAEALEAELEAETGARMQGKPYDYDRVDYEKMGAGLQRFGEHFPANESHVIRAAASKFLTYSARYAPATYGKWNAILQQSANPMLRDMAGSAAQLAAARAQPMVMRFTAVDGREVDVARLRGKVVLIDFWAATWCGACKEQEPLLKEVYAKYHDLGFEIIGIACEMKESDQVFLLDYVKRHQMPWPQYCDGKAMRNEDTIRYGFTGIPQYLLLGPDGLLAAHSSSSGGLRNLEAVVRQQLGLPPLQPGDATKVLGARN